MRRLEGLANLIFGSMDSLKVPKVRAILEYTNFIILFILYVQALEGLGQKKVNARESLFIIYAMGEFSFDSELESRL